MSVEFERSSSLDQLIEDLIQYDEFRPLTTMGQLKFKALLKLTFNREEEIVPCKGWRAELKKVSPLFRLYVEADYVLVVDAYTVSNSPDHVVEAYAHRALMTLQVNLSNSGRVKIARRSPDITEYRKTVSRYGTWNQEITAFQTMLETVSRQSAEQLTAITQDRVQPVEET